MYFHTSSLHFHEEDFNTNNFFKLFKIIATTRHSKPDAVNIRGPAATTQEWQQQDSSELHLGTPCGKYPMRGIGRVMR